ncbi:MAG: Fe(3+) ABC transporter substrate-binding protein [Spirochaetaceae bacterium]
MTNKIILISMLLLSVTLFGKSAKESNTDKNEVNVYTHRHYDIDKQLFEQFTKETGIVVNVVKADADQLIERLKNEGVNSPADILITADAGRLYKAKELDLLSSISPSLLKNVPKHLKDSDNKWFALTKRARVFAYNKDKVDPKELSTYSALTDDKWRGRVVIRSSSNLYNQSLLASIIAIDGEEEAKIWAQNMVKNMAREPKGNDRDQMKAIAAGIADVAVVNTYYLGKLLTSSSEEEVKVGKQMGIFFPNQEGRGAHINISGAGLTKHGKNRANAELLIEFLLSVEAQEKFAKGNFEYPVNPNAKVSDLVNSWGKFKEDTINLSLLGENNTAAVKVFDEAGWK